MLDIKKIRAEKEKIEQALLKRMPEISFDEILRKDVRKRELQTELDSLRENKNKVSNLIPRLKKEQKDVSEYIEQMKNVGNKIEIYQEEYRTLDEEIFKFLSSLPNVPDEEVLPGGKENNQVIKVFNKKPEFNFEIKDHVKLARNLKLIDYERGVKISGEGSWVYTNLGARLEWALINYFIDSHIKDGWNFMLVPHMLRYECGFTAGQFPKFTGEEYWLDQEENEQRKFLLPTAETALVSLHMNEILNIEDLPRKYFSYTPCYRKESGSSRIEERGTIRGHQFNKVELVQYTEENKSDMAFKEMLEKAEKILQDLNVHYRVSKLAANDCSASMCKTYDLEIYIPSINIYKEVSSVSNARDYQARRGNTRYKDLETGKNKYVHTLNASGLATSRLFPALLEQCQQPDGSILIPEVLRKYTGFEIIK